MFSEVEGSAALWERDPDGMRDGLDRHDDIVRRAVAGNRGNLVRERGDADSFFAIFASASDAVAAALEIQLAINSDEDSKPQIRLRMALNTGEAEFRRGDYYGPAVNRCARMRSLAYGGQTLISQSTRDLAHKLPSQLSLRDLGQHRLKDLSDPEHIYQLAHPDLPSEFPALSSLDAMPNNLPHQVTEFIGRRNQIEEAKEHLASSRLLTFTGSGGCGKTRLAIQVGAEVLDLYRDGVWLIELAGLSDSALVPQAVLSALHVREIPGEKTIDTIVEFLQERRCLLILDNCEHLIGACADASESVLTSCPNTQILATSREPLGVQGEAARRVPSLSCPNPAELAIERISDFEAVQLFELRARMADPNFQIDKDNMHAIAQVCHRLDGIPLALELAAARVKVLSVSEIAERLDNRFTLLTGGSRDALPRQQTLKALVDWSYDLLEPAEQLIWKRLSVLSGGFTLEAAESICSGDGIDKDDVLLLVAQLVDKSLLLAETGRAENRYRQLQTIRDYGRSLLAGSGEEKRLISRHLEWFTEFAELAEQGLAGQDQKGWLDRLDEEIDNFRAAMVSPGSDNESISNKLRLSSAIWEFFEIRGHITEGRTWLEESLASSEGTSDEVMAKAFKAAGNLAEGQADYDAARRYYEQHLAIEQELGRDLEVAKAYNNLGVLNHHRSDLEGASKLYEKSLELMRKLNQPRSVAILLNNLGSIAQSLGHNERAIEIYEESLEIRRRLSDHRGIAQTLMNLGNIAKNEHEFETAKLLYEESRGIRQELGDKSGTATLMQNLAAMAAVEERDDESLAFYRQALVIKRGLGERKAIAECLEGIAHVYSRTGSPETAARLLGSAESLRKSIGAPRDTFTPNETYRELLLNAKEQLGETAFKSACDDGALMSLDDAVTAAIESEN